MQCIVTAGPTFEALDEVRRLTNLSTGTLGAQLANALVERGHLVTLLNGQYATYQGPQLAQKLIPFSTGSDLAQKLQDLAQATQTGAIFHLAAVSDFSFGRIWRKLASGQLQECKAGKLSTRHGTLTAELVPTPKIIANLRAWFSGALVIGWKFEVEGDRAGAIAQAREQIGNYQTDACVANGPAYGAGFGFIRPNGQGSDLPDKPALFRTLAEFIEA
jgi:phosphopantothenate---cysteine ligase (CTP)